MGSTRRRSDVPLPVALVALVTIIFFALPLAGLLWRAPWSNLRELLTTRSSLDALRLSLVCSLSSAAISTVAGIPLAWLLARVAFPGRSVVRAMTTLSMVLPPVVGGVALFLAFGRHGLMGQFLDRWFGLQLPFSTAGVIVAETFVSMPFLIFTVEAAIRSADRAPEEAARTLGGSRWYTFRRVTLPTVRPALVAGIVLAWARALGEFGATITFAGNFPGRTQTLPLLVYLGMESNPQQAIALALVLVAVSLIVLSAFRDRWLGALRIPVGG